MIFKFLREVFGRAVKNEFLLARYARTAYDLVVKIEPAEYRGRRDRLWLRPNHKFSRVPGQKLELGALELMLVTPGPADAVKHSDDVYVIERENLLPVLYRLASVIEHDEIPRGRHWKAECRYAPPVSVKGVDYFTNVYVDGKPVAPKGLRIYRTKDSRSEKFLENIFSIPRIAGVARAQSI